MVLAVVLPGGGALLCCLAARRSVQPFGAARPRQPGSRHGDLKAGAGARAAAFPVSAQAQMVVQRELAAVGRLSRCRSAPSPFLELLPFFAGSF
jgi:hypothetical protein|uniref:cDNA, clone: J100065D04, full insert sequence n=2 Tax=Oryza TaxID=4527 RepID=B7FAD5_ORYSJ|nr:unnamed protein product [Oryza sativa Japonica Group]